MEKLDTKQIQHYCLNIAKELDRICTKHNIPYYMLGGTMLGAIRHNGFIPWDDDMDFGVPYDYYYQLIDILKEELKDPYHCCSHNNSKCIFFPFIKIEDSSTILDDKSLPVPTDQKIGINIDIFPLIYCGSKIDDYKKIKKLSQASGRIFSDSRNHKMINALKRVIRTFWPITRERYITTIYQLYDKIEPGNYLGNIGGRWKEKEIIPVEWYGEMYYNFCDTKFRGIKESHLYLQQMYGDYMKLPPENQQFVHSEKAYKK